MRTNQLVSLAVVLGLIAAAFGLLGNGAPLKDAAPRNTAPSQAPSDWPQRERIVDLTHAFDEQTIPWPTEVGFRLERGFDGVTDGGWYYRANRLSMAEHCGTHLDAPNHFAKDGESAADVPLARLIGPGLVVDVSAECAHDPDFLITTEVLQAWERNHGRSLADSIVLLNTGQTKTFGAHVVLCGHGIPAFENLTNPDQLPPDGFTVIALPMKIRTGSGGPLRAIAVLPAAAITK